MEPSWPVARYWGQWTPDLGFMDQYAGTVIRASLDSIPIPPGRFPRRYDPRSLLFGDWTMDAAVVKGPPPVSLAPILNIYDGEEREVTMLGALGEDLVYRERSRARLARLDQPDLRVQGVLAGTAVGDTMQLGVSRMGGWRCLSFDERRSCAAFTPGRAWSLLLYPEGLREGSRRALDALWMFLIWLPVGFWSKSWSGLAARGLLGAVGVGFAVGLTRLVSPPWVEVVAALAGLLAGSAAAVRTRPQARSPLRRK